METLNSGMPPNGGAAFGSSEFAALYNEHVRSIYYLALRMLGDAALAEDAAHDVLLKAFQNQHQFRGESGLRTWLYRIAINHCQNVMKSWHSRKMVNNLDDGFLDASPGRGDSPLRVLENAELGERIQTALGGLPEEYRLLLLLVADRELSYEQIGELTRQSGDAVRGKLHRAQKAFAAAFHQTE